jgi:hypothetical protein
MQAKGRWVCVKCWCSCGSCAEADGMTHGPFERPWRRAVVLWYHKHALTLQYCTLVDHQPSAIPYPGVAEVSTWYHKHALTLQYCTLTSPRRSSAISRTLPWRVPKQCAPCLCDWQCKHSHPDFIIFLNTKDLAASKGENRRI